VEEAEAARPRRRPPVRGRCEAGAARARDADAQAGAVRGQVATAEWEPDLLEMASCCSASPASSRAPVFFFCSTAPSSPPRRNAKEPGALHKEDVAVEAMDRGALLPLLQAIPRCSFHHLVVASRAQVSLTTLFSVMWTWPSS
jgi:hypothetical protein